MTVLIPGPARAVISPEQILTGAVYLMQERGRAFGNYDDRTGHLCALGAMAVAAGKEPDSWEGLRGAYPHWLEEGDAELIEAARRLAAVVKPGANPDTMLPEDLIEGIGDWHDGTSNTPSEKPNAPANSVVFAAFAEAGQLVEQAGEAA